MKYIYIITLILFFGSCAQNEIEQSDIIYISPHEYTYVNIDNHRLNYFETDYLPVYPTINHQVGRRFKLTTTIYVRNISTENSAYLLSVQYFDTFGHILEEYIDSSIYLAPLETIELVVKNNNKMINEGSTFLIRWGAVEYSNQLLIQGVMIRSNGQQGISLVTDAVKVKSNK